MINMKKLTHRLLATTFSVVALSGCASVFNTAGESTFACAEGCPTPLEVYERTHQSPNSVQVGRTPESWGIKGATSSAAKEHFNYGSAAGLAQSQFTAASAEQGVAAPKPIRNESKVIRIWVAPWIDSQDNLHWAGYVFSEVTPKRWSVGEQSIRFNGLPPAFQQR